MEKPAEEFSVLVLDRIKCHKFLKQWTMFSAEPEGVLRGVGCWRVGWAVAVGSSMSTLMW